MNKSKTWLATALIESGVAKFPEGANWATQDKSDKRVSFYDHCKPERDPAYCDRWGVDGYIGGSRVQLPALNPQWHQTVLSRDEFDQFVAETVSRSTAVGDDETNLAAEEELRALTAVESPEQRAKLAHIYAPTLDQLLQDWRNADDFAQRKQTEADEAAAMRDERWQAVQARAGEMNVTVGRCESRVTEPELVITDWRELRVGDIIEYVDGDIKDKIGMTGPVVELALSAEDGMFVRLKCDNGPNKGRLGWPREWRFIRRP